MIGVGIIGLGTVGAGTYRILTENCSLIKQKTGLDIEVVKIAEIDHEKNKRGSDPERHAYKGCT